jgi:hypothetical protein
MSGQRTFRTAGHAKTTADPAPVDETAPAVLPADARPPVRASAVPSFDRRWAERALETAVTGLAAAERRAAERRAEAATAVQYALAAGVSAEVVSARLVVAGLDPGIVLPEPTE